MIDCAESPLIDYARVTRGAVGFRIRIPTDRPHHAQGRRARREGGGGDRTQAGCELLPCISSSVFLGVFLGHDDCLTFLRRIQHLVFRSSDPTLPFAAILLMGCPVVAAAVACWSWRRKPAEAQRHAQPAPSPSPSPSPSAPTASGVAGVGRTSAEPVGKATHGGLAGEILQVSHV